MKKIFLFISLIVAMASSGQLPWTPGTQPRSLPANRPEDYNLWVRNQFGLPLFNDTTQANTNTNLDTCGRLIFTYDVDDFWVRKCSPVKHWERAAGSVILPTCGLQPGTGVVTYDDSTLNFDISPAIYALCCDHVPRTSPFTHVTLDSNTADNPRIDAIVLTENGTVGVIKGTPDPNPAQPQIGCDFLLTYVTVNAHENIPANFRANPIIYDEGIIPPQWDTLATAVSANFLDQTLPIHLTHDISVGAITGGSSALTFTLTDSSINLADYGVLKFYIRLKAPYPAAGTNLNIMDLTWYLDSNPVSNPLTFALNQFGMQNSAAAYFVIAIPVDTWQYQSLIANRLVIRFLRSNASGMYLDWIQLQTGLVQTGTSVRSFAASGNILFNTVVSNPTSNVVLQMPLLNQLPNTVFLQDTSINFPPHFGKLDLSNDNFFSNTLNVTRIAPGPDGTYLGTEGGTVQWLPKQVDTTIVKNGAYREVNGINTTDTLTHGYWKRDSAVFVYPNTYIGMNSNTFAYEQGSTDFWKIASNGINAFVTQSGSRFEWTTGINVTAANNLTLGNDGNVFTVTGNTQINALTTANWQSGSQVVLIFSGTPVVKNNTAGGAGTARILLAGSTDFTAAANDALTLVYDGFNWHETSRKQSGASTLSRFGVAGEDATAAQARNFDLNTNHFIISSASNVSATDNMFTFSRSGSHSTSNNTTTTVAITNTQTSGFLVTGTNIGLGVSVSTASSFISNIGISSLATGTGSVGIQGTGDNFGVIGTSFGSTVATGVLATGNQAGVRGDAAQSNAGAGVLGTGKGNIDAGSLAISGYVTTQANNVVNEVMTLQSQGLGGSPPFAAIGLGVSMTFRMATTGTQVPTVPIDRGPLANRIRSYWTNATDASQTSQLVISGMNTAVEQDILSAHGSGVVGIGIITGYSASRLEVVDNTGATFTSVITSNAVANALRVTNSSAGIAIFGSSTTGTGGAFNGGGNAATAALQSFKSTGGLSALFTTSDATTNTVYTGAKLTRASTGTPANGIGVSFDFAVGSTTGPTGDLSNQLISTWQDATGATETSQFKITGVNNAATGDIIYFEGNKRTRFNGRAEFLQGANVAAANDLTLGLDGNVFTITGNTQINAITTANWQAGSEIILIFTGTPTVKNNTAGGAGTAVLLLAGGVDFSATANDVLTIVYNGTSFFEKSRSVN